MAPSENSRVPSVQAPADVTGAVAEAMHVALAEARRALAAGEPPIGACLLSGATVLASAHTGVVAGPDATAHAEILAIRAACGTRRSLRLEDTVLVVTVEPCAMCLAACHYAGIGHVVYGAPLSALAALTGTELRGPVPHGLVLTGGVAAAECTALLADWGRMRHRRGTVS